MTSTTYTGATVELDADGFFLDPLQWRPEMADAIAHDNGIDTLTERHWQVITFMRDTYLETGTAPTIRTLGKASGVAIKELYEL